MIYISKRLLWIVGTRKGEIWKSVGSYKPETTAAAVGVVLAMEGMDRCGTDFAVFIIYFF